MDNYDATASKKARLEPASRTATASVGGDDDGRASEPTLTSRLHVPQHQIDALLVQVRGAICARGGNPTLTSTS